jgi:hypothetical protein
LGRWAVAAAFGLVLAGPAAAEDVAPVFAVAHDEMAALMRLWGYKAEITEEEQGTFIDSETENGVPFWITLLDCTHGARPRCASVAFNAQFTSPASDDYLAQWNSGHWWGTASRLNEGDPLFVWTLNLEGGVSRNVLNAALKRFASMADEFSDYINQFESGDGQNGRGLEPPSDAPPKP